MLTAKTPLGWIPGELNPEGFETIVDILAFSSQRYAERPAFTCMGHSLTYAELDRLSAAFAGWIQEETTLKPGDRIAIQLPNILQYPVVLFGAMRAGLVVVNTNPLYTPREMRHQFTDAGVRALVAYQGMADRVEQVLPDTTIEYLLLTRIGDLHPFPKRTLLNLVVKHVKKMEPAFDLPQAISLRTVLNRSVAQASLPSPDLSRQAIAVLQYTGGTTGVAKGAMLTHANLVSNVLQGLDGIKTAPLSWANCVISPLPLYHIYAFTLALAVMVQGGNSVLIPNPRDINGFVKTLTHYSPTGFLGLNTLFIALARHRDIDQVDFSQLALTASGGMALTHAAASLWEKCTGSPIVEGYGLTETSPIVSINPPGAQRIGTIGLPVAHTEVRIVSVSGDDVGEGEAGELCVRGPQVMLGYWRRDDATRASMTEDGFFRTGDIARCHADGFLSIVDRAKDMIIVSGFNVYPNEVEEVASSHPDVVECAVVGVPDEETGEAVKLFVVPLDERLTARALREWCKRDLTAYKVPRHIEFVDDLPKSPVGKVLRRLLRSPENRGAHI